MKSIKNMFLTVVAVALLAIPAMATPKVFQCSEQEKAAIGATHLVKVTYSDLTTATTNTAQTFTNDVLALAAKQGASLVCMKLKTAFDTENTNYTGSMAVKVGDSNDDDCFLTSTELASDGTEVFLKFGRVFLNDTAVNTATYSTRVITNCVYDGGTTTGNVTIVSGITTTTNSVSNIGKVLYTSDNYVKFTFTPNAEEALSANTAGEVWFYFRFDDSTK